MTDPKRIVINAPGEATMLAAKHLAVLRLSPADTVLNASARNAIDTVLLYISTTHNALPLPPHLADPEVSVADIAAAFTEAATNPDNRPVVLPDAPEPQGEAAILAELRQARADRNTARARIALARQAFIADGYFTPDEVGDDIAPRITEWSVHHREQLADAELAASEARGEAVRVAAILREILTRYRPLTDHRGRVAGWTALGVTPADFDRWAAVAFTAAGAVEEELSTLVSGHLAAFDDQTVTPPTDAPQSTSPGVKQPGPNTTPLENVYRERAHLLAWLAALNPAVIAPAPDVEEPDWQLLFIDAGGRQASWHIAPRDAELFVDVDRVEPGDPRAQWDGHTTTAKYLRIAAHVADLGARRALTDARCAVTNVPHGPHTWYRNAGGEAHCPGRFYVDPATGKSVVTAEVAPLPQRRSAFGSAADTVTMSAEASRWDTAEIAVACSTCSQPIQGTISDHMAEAHGMPKIWPNSPLYVDDSATPDAELVHPATEPQASVPPEAGDCGPDCADSHMYDGYCTQDPHLDGVTTPGHETPHREGAAWSCAEDDGCGHLSLGHSSEAAARRSYDRHRARTCPRTSEAGDPT